MKEQELKLIEQLAEKLGTTADYLWGILVKQAPIQSMIMLFQYILIAIFGYVLFKIHKYLSIKKDYNGYNESGYAHYKEPVILSMIGGFTFFIILVVCAFFSLDEFFNGFFNPEYWALSKVLKELNNN